jgi:hypothetical protein
VKTDGTIPRNKPDIIIRVHGKEICLPIDNAILEDRNVIKKEAETSLKYKDLTTEIQRMLNVKTKPIPVITVATGITSSHSENI